MLPKNVNIIGRKYINDNVNMIKQLRPILKDVSIYSLVANWINVMYKCNNIILSVRGSMVFSLLVTDTYKILNHKLKYNIITDEEIILFDLIKSGKNINNIYMSVKSNFEQFALLVKSTYQFYNMNILGQRLLFSELEEKDNHYLNELVLTHQNDMDYYLKPLSIDQIFKIYDELKDKYQYDLQLKTENDYEIINKLIYYFKKLKLNNPSNYEIELNELKKYLEENELEANTLEDYIKETILYHLSNDDTYEYTKK